MPLDDAAADTRHTTHGLCWQGRPCRVAAGAATSSVSLSSSSRGRGPSSSSRGQGPSSSPASAPHSLLRGRGGPREEKLRAPRPEPAGGSRRREPPSPSRSSFSLPLLVPLVLLVLFRGPRRCPRLRALARALRLVGVAPGGPALRHPLPPRSAGAAPRQADLPAMARRRRRGRRRVARAEGQGEGRDALGAVPEAEGLGSGRVREREEREPGVAGGFGAAAAGAGYRRGRRKGRSAAESGRGSGRRRQHWRHRRRRRREAPRLQRRPRPYFENHLPGIPRSLGLRLGHQRRAGTPLGSVAAPRSLGLPVPSRGRPRAPVRV